jgi:short-subunit dehydrogenase
MKLEGKRVLITGASTGIGRVAAKLFIEEGTRVIAVARTAERLETLASELGGPPKIVPIVADVTDAASMDAMARRVLDDGGAPDVVVANAGIGVDSLFTETPDAAYEQVLAVNVLGVVRTVRPFVSEMVERGSGRILMISSIVGKRGIPHYAAYSASKFAVHGIAEALRTELHGTGVSVGVVCPASTETEFNDRKIRRGPSQRGSRVAKHSAESVARAVVQMARSKRREMVLTAEGKLLKWANVVAPGVLDRVLARMLLRRE